MHFQRKHAVNLSIFGKKAELQLSFWRKHRVICALSAVYSVFREEAELHIFGKVAECNKAFLPKTQSETLYFWQKCGIHANPYLLVWRNSKFDLQFILILGLGLVYYSMMPKKFEKRTIKSR
jgi:hypothetical protein